MVFHPGERRLKGLSLSLTVTYFVPRRTQTWTVHWTGNRVRRSPRLRRITIDTDRQRRVVGDGIFTPRGRVIYTTGPRINYPEIVRLHLSGVIRGNRDHYGDPITAESVRSQTPESTAD
jgi:hypothetical protein